MFCMHYHFTLCNDCKQEIIKEGAQKLDFSYNDTEPSEHICSANQKRHPDNGTNLMQNART